MPKPRPRGRGFDVPAAPVALVPAPRPAADPGPPERVGVDEDQELVLEDLTREQVLDWRDRAAADHQIIFDHVVRCGETSAQRLFTRAFVATVQRLSALVHLELGYMPWEQA
ncbi:hypothetical protein ACFYYS_17980 [Streptomyces sp. NPDC002120]|uniref:hypothetical protein n=1 Tax=Streptomyces sp. NPDC002120 TaxID=3364631 RepID=UPI0036B0EF20